MSRTRALGAILAIGLGLVAAPFAFQMFTRAPKGGQMLDELGPFMTEAKVAAFRDHMSVIRAAHTEVPPAVLRGSTTPSPATDAWVKEWPSIDQDMGDMLDVMDDNLGGYRAVAALPPFPLFPWFFVLPGLIAVAVAGSALWSGRRQRPAQRRAVALAALGIGLIAAPFAFQMFTRAPKGGAMIEDFKPFMTPAKVTDVQRYFLTLGAAEGELRTQVVPASGRAAPPATARWFDRWPTISNEMAPMIGAMSDNVDNFAAVAALPPFPLFPWFFVAPGLMVAGLALAARRAPEPAGVGTQEVET